MLFWIFNENDLKIKITKQKFLNHMYIFFQFWFSSMGTELYKVFLLLFFFSNHRCHFIKIPQAVKFSTNDRKIQLLYNRISDSFILKFCCHSMIDKLKSLNTHKFIFYFIIIIVILYLFNFFHISVFCMIKFF